MISHIHHIRSKPHHIRRQVALMAAGGLTALIALVWVVGSLASGAYAVSQASFADAVQTPVETSKGVQGSALLGAADAAFSKPDAPAHLEVVDDGRSVPTSKPVQKEQTILPF